MYLKDNVLWVGVETRERETDEQMETERQRDRDGQRHRPTDAHMREGAETERQRDREGERRRDGETERLRQRDISRTWLLTFPSLTEVIVKIN